MSTKFVAAGAALVLALCGAAAAAAAGSAGSAPSASTQNVPQTPVEGAISVFDAALVYLDIDTQTLVHDLRNGQSLAQIAAAQGKTADGLVSAVVAAAQTQLDTAVAAGKLDSAKEQALLTKLRTELGALVNKNFAAGARQAGTERPQPVTMFLQPLLSRLKLHIETVPNKGSLRSKVNNGTSLAQIAIGQAKLKLDASVAAGRLTAAQEALLLSRLKAITAAFVSGAHS